MQIRLKILEGKDAGQERSFQLTNDGRLLIGRGDDCDVPLWDEAASRHHAAIERKGKALRVIDLGSSNGTIVEGSSIDEVEIHGGERIDIGSTQIRVELADARSRPTAILRPDRDFKIESTLSREAIDLGARVAQDAEHQTRLNLLLELVEEVQSAEDGETILKRLLKQARAALRTTRGALVPVASRSKEPLWDEALHEGGDPSAEISRSVIRQVVSDGHAIQVCDVSSDPRTRSRESIVGRPVGSILAVPVAGRQRTHAVLYLESPPERSFAEEDLAFAATFGQVAGMALQNAERLQRSRRLLHTQEKARPDEILTQSEALLHTLDLLGRFAGSGGPVLINGETGTGKELLARQAHRDGPFPTGSWIPVNCAAIPSTLLESELFGHEKGAFTGATGRKAGMFELAHEGTLFLDEIGDMPLELQSKLLRVLEAGEFFRIGGRAPVSVQLLVVSATHRDLAEKVAAGEFREDLFFRLNRFQVQIPPLRDRPDDVLLLARKFLEAAAQRLGSTLTFSSAAVDALRDYDWPGNVRELRNVVERGAVLCPGDEVGPGDLIISAGAVIRPGGGRVPSGGSAEDGPPPSLEEVEAEAIRRAMDYTGGKKGEAAQILGIAWPTLRRKLRKYGLEEAP